MYNMSGAGMRAYLRGQHAQVGGSQAGIGGQSIKVEEGRPARACGDSKEAPLALQARPLPPLCQTEQHT
jgi:hypothetical protein